MRKLIVATLSLSFAAVFLAGPAQATDRSPAKRGLERSAAVMKSTGGLLMAAAGAPAPKSAGEEQPMTNKKPTTKKKPKVRKQAGGKGKDYLSGTKGADLVSGGAGKDTFRFTHDPRFTDNNTLDDGDRITDYEFGETIIITGVRLKDKNIRIVYDAKKKETRIELDLPDREGKTDGKIDRTIILTGDKRGTLNKLIPCCISKSTEISIEKTEKPKTAKGKTKVKKKAKTRAKTRAKTKRRVKRHRVKRRPSATHRPVRRVRRVPRKNRYPNEDSSVLGGE